MTATKCIRQFLQVHKILMGDWVFPTHWYRVKAIGSSLASRTPSGPTSPPLFSQTFFTSAAAPAVQVCNSLSAAHSFLGVLLEQHLSQTAPENTGMYCRLHWMKRTRSHYDAGQLAGPLEISFSLLCTKPNPLTMLLSAACSSWSCLSSTRQRFGTSL